MSLITALTPTNLSEEKERFFNSDQYHPQLTYDWDVDKLKKQYKDDTEVLDFLDAIFNQDHRSIVLQAKKYFRSDLRQEHLNEAKKCLSTPLAKKPREDIQRIKTSFEKAFRFFDLDYTFTYSNQQGFFFRPNAKNKTIVASLHADLQFFSIDGEVKHEMTHILRYENTRHNNIKRSPYYIETEEGLASYMQDYHGDYGAHSLFQHAAEYAVTEVGLRGSLRDMVDYLVAIGFTKELAWQRSVRHKFGFIDTSQPGDIMKPAMYFANEQKVQELTADERLRLFVGKIRMDELPMYPTYRGIIPESKLREFYSMP